MTIYNTILQILKRNKGSLLLGLIITFVVTFLYAEQLKDNPQELSGTTIVIFDQDQSKISQGLVKQLKQQQQVVKLKDTSQKGIDDALYFDKAQYILTIPKNFGKELTAGKKVKVTSQTKPGTFSKTLVDTTIDHFLNTYQTFQKEMPNLSQGKILALTNKNLNQTGTVHFDQNYHKKRQQNLKASIFNLLAYGLFTTIFSGYAVVNLAFNRKEIRQRNSCSPLSRRKISRHISIGNFIYALLSFAVFLIYVVIATGSGWNQLTGYFILNALVFFSVMVSFSIFATSLVKNSESIAGINNVFIMGTCFISGVFVASDILPDVVNKIAAFTPTYWFVQNNQLLAKTIHFNQAAFRASFLQQTLILLAFTAVFSVLHLITMKERGGLATFSKKEKSLLEQ